MCLEAVLLGLIPGRLVENDDSKENFMILIIIALLLNIWVWFFPQSFINYIKFGKNELTEKIIPSQKEIWTFIEKPNYIWYVRIALGLTLIGLVIFVFWW